MMLHYHRGRGGMLPIYNSLAFDDGRRTHVQTQAEKSRHNSAVSSLKL
jgi:hypothetical protein